jgi:hypothetical protein
VFDSNIYANVNMSQHNVWIPLKLFHHDLVAIEIEGDLIYLRITSIVM